MRAFQFCALFLLLGFGAGTGAVAQVPDEGTSKSWWHSHVGLLGHVRVRDELKLTNDQLSKLKEIGDEYLENHFRPFEEATRKLTQGEADQKLADLEEPRQKALERAKAVLTAEQAARLFQITIWARGPFAFTEPEVARKLDLTVSQKGALKTIGDEYKNEAAALGKHLRRAPAARLTKEEQVQRAEQIAQLAKPRDELRAAKEAECQAVLTDPQKARFIELRGARFDLDKDPSRAP